MKKKNAASLLPWAVLAASYLFAVLVYALIGRHNVNADMASEMVLADLLNREGGFLSPNWYYSTELRVISPVPVYQLALRIFPGNWHMARTLSLGILLAVLPLRQFIWVRVRAAWFLSYTLRRRACFRSARCTASCLPAAGSISCTSPRRFC